MMGDNSDLDLTEVDGETGVEPHEDTTDHDTIPEGFEFEDEEDPGLLPLDDEADEDE